MTHNHLLPLILLLALCGGTYAQDTYRITHYDEGDGLMEAEIFQGYQDKEGLIWFASRDGLLRYDSHRFKTFKAYPGDDCPLMSNHIGRFEDHGDKILCLSQDKTYLFDKRTGKFTQTQDTLSRQSHDTAYGRITEKIKSMPEFRGMDKLKVRLIDRQGGVWVRTNRGLERIEPVMAKPSPTKTGSEPEEEVRALMRGRNGDRWIADKNGYIKIYDRRGTLSYLTPDGTRTATRRPFGSRAYCIYEDSRGRVWIGCKPGGLILMERNGERYSVRRFREDKTRYSLCGDGIYDIAEDSRGRLWIAAYGGGLNMVDENVDGEIRFLNRRNTMTSYPAEAIYTRGIAIRRDGILVAATNEGLLTARVAGDVSRMRFRMNRRRVNDASSLPTDYLNDVIETKDGRTVITTNGGGICYTRAQGDALLKGNISFTTYNSQGNTATDVFLTLTEDHDGNVWAVGKTSLTKIQRGGARVENFMKGHFDGTFMFSEAMPVCADDGTMTLGTTQGHLTLDTRKMGKSTFVPSIKIYTADTIRLSPEEKSLMVSFSAIDYSRHEPITYAYIMEGIDKEWQYTRDNHIYYGSLPGGTYRLRVRSTNSDGVWTDNEKSVLVIRRPAFNETRAAWMLYGILLIISATIIYHTLRYIRKLRREMTSYQLKASEQIEYMASRIRELTSHPSPDTATADEGSDTHGDEDFTAKAKAYVQEHIADSDITVETFAQHMNMSKSLLYLKCKKHLNHTPSNYIQNTRMSHAAQLLKSCNGSPNISDIAYRCGFSDPKYFSRCFKKCTGVTPSEYAAQTHTASQKAPATGPDAHDTSVEDSE